MQKQEDLAEAPEGFQEHPHWQLAQRIIASPTFARSARLKTFLLYVTRCALADHPDQVTEQQIGVHVFGKPADYNASEDNIVRSQARFLRGKLAEYYESEAGRAEPVVLTIPKGTYLPHFDPRPEETPAEPAAHAETPATAEPTPRSHRRWVYWALGAVAVVVGGAAVFLRLAAPVASPANDGRLWSRLFNPQRQTTIVASDYIFSMVQEAAGRTLTLDEYLGADYFNQVSRLNAVSGLDHLFPNIAQRHYTGFENVTIVARLMQVKQAQAAHPVVRFGRDMTMRDVGSGDLILLGSKQSNPWVLLFEDKLNFRFEYQSALHNIFITNRAPQPGEEREYRPSALDELSRVIYGEIAFLPNLNHGDNVLILQGTSMAASEMALEMIDNPTLFRTLAQRLGGARNAADLPYFEALIRTRTVNGVAGESEIVAVRTLRE